MGILKWIGQAFKMTFLENDFAKSLKNEISPPRNYQKETAESLSEILKLQKDIHKDMSK